MFAKKLFKIAITILFCLILGSLVCQASSITITETAEYAMGDGETKHVASQRAIELARRQASEKAGVYIESYTKTVNHTIEIDEINFISASIMRDIEKPSIKTILTNSGDIHLIATIVVEINPEQIPVLIDRMHDNVSSQSSISAADYNRVCLELEKNKKELEELKLKYKSTSNNEEKKRIEESLQLEEKSFIYNLLMKKACTAAINNEMEKAISYCTDSINWNPVEFSAYNYRGLVKFAIKDYNGAKDDFTLAIKYAKTNDDKAMLYNNRGFVYNQGLNQQKEALTDIEKAITLDPTDALYYSNKGRIYISLGDDEFALKCFEDSLRLNPNLVSALILQGRLLLYKGEYTKALKNVNNVLKLSPNKSEAYVDKGNIYSYMKDYKKAEYYIKKGLEITPNSEYALKILADNYLEMGKNIEAIEICDKIIKINPKYSDAYNTKGNVYSSEKKFKQAIESYTQAINIDPFYNYYYNRALTYHEIGKLQLAINDLEKIKETVANPQREIIDTLEQYKKEVTIHQ